jgi:hypothetical protein
MTKKTDDKEMRAILAGHSKLLLDASKQIRDLSEALLRQEIRIKGLSESITYIDRKINAVASVLSKKENIDPSEFQTELDRIRESKFQLQSDIDSLIAGTNKYLGDDVDS